MVLGGVGCFIRGHHAAHLNSRMKGSDLCKGTAALAIVGAITVRGGDRNGRFEGGEHVAKEIDRSTKDWQCSGLRPYLQARTPIGRTGPPGRLAMSDGPRTVDGPSPRARSGALRTGVSHHLWASSSTSASIRFPISAKCGAATHDTAGGPILKPGDSATSRTCSGLSDQGSAGSKSVQLGYARVERDRQSRVTSHDLPTAGSSDCSSGEAPISVARW
jgi:hypothetical protein